MEASGADASGIFLGWRLARHACFIGWNRRPPGPYPLQLKDIADAFVFILGLRDSLTMVLMSRADLEGTPYGREMNRRL